MDVVFATHFPPNRRFFHDIVTYLEFFGVLRELPSFIIWLNFKPIIFSANLFRQRDWLSNQVAECKLAVSSGRRVNLGYGIVVVGSIVIP